MIDAYQTSSQRDVGLARQAVLRAVQRLQADAGVSERRAMQTLLTQGAAGRLTGDVATAMLTLARDGRGRKHAQGLNAMPSLRTLERWMERARLASTSAIPLLLAGPAARIHHDELHDMPGLSLAVTPLNALHSLQEHQLLPGAVQ